MQEGMKRSHFLSSCIPYGFDFVFSAFRVFVIEFELHARIAAYCVRGSF